MNRRITDVNEEINLQKIGNGEKIIIEYASRARPTAEAIIIKKYNGDYIVCSNDGRLDGGGGREAEKIGMRYGYIVPPISVIGLFGITKPVCITIPDKNFVSEDDF